MAKSSSDAEFLAQLRSQRGGQRADTGPGMILHTPPAKSSKSLDDIIASEGEAAQTPIPAASGSSAAPNAIDHSTAADGSLGRIVSIDLLDPHPWNARVHRSAERVREIASQIAATRQNHPILVTRNPDHPGRYYVVDGETRFRGLKLLNRREAWILEADVDPADPLAFYTASFKQTDATEAISSIDKGIKWATLIEEKHATATSIAEALELAQSTVSRMIAYRKFPPAVLDFMHSNAEKFPYSVAAVLAQLVDQGWSEDALLTKCQEVVDSQYSRRAIESLVKGAKTDSEKKPRKSAVVAIPIKAGATQVGSFRTYESGALEFKLSTAAALSPENYKALSDVFEVVSGLITEGHEQLIDELSSRLAKLRNDG
ncbi:ParB/RepB/Spo0J family partition protein [Paraburkholderia youngii]|uniref:ParB/RepB/Spo0J family partition protein n=1 Tax=Paraburkholderia youngii TaxID=2782701 RepID=UPI003D22DA95